MVSQWHSVQLVVNVRREGSLGQAFQCHPNCQPDEKGAEGTEHKSVPLRVKAGTRHSTGRWQEAAWGTQPLKATTRKGVACSSATGLG